MRDEATRQRIERLYNHLPWNPRWGPVPEVPFQSLPEPPPAPSGTSGGSPDDGRFGGFHCPDAAYFRSEGPIDLYH